MTLIQSEVNTPPILDTLPAIFSENGTSILDKVSSIVLRYFTLGQAIFFSGYGLSNVLFTRSVSSIDHPVKRHLRDLIVSNQKFIGSFNFNVVQGLQFEASGVLLSLAELQRLGWINFGMGAYTILQAVGKFIFGFANVIGFIYNIILYKAALDVPNDASSDQLVAKNVLLKSSFMGIVSTACYVTATVLTIFSLNPLVILIFSAIGLVFGCIKFFYDKKYF